MSTQWYHSQLDELGTTRDALNVSHGGPGFQDAIMNAASPIHHEEYAPLHSHRGRLLPIAVSMLCYASILAALIASAYLV